MGKNIASFYEQSKKYSFPLAPNPKEELIDFIRSGIKVAQENRTNFDIAEDVNLAIQSAILGSKLYQKYPKLEEINNELLGFENIKQVSSNKTEAERTLNIWHSYIEVIPQKIEEALKV